MNSAVTAAREDTFSAARGSVVVVRDQEWLVTNVERATDGWFVHAQGLSELVREATFSTALEQVRLRPADGVSPVYGNNRFLLCTLTKAFLSSPATLLETVRERGRSGSPKNATSSREYQGSPQEVWPASDDPVRGCHPARVSNELLRDERGRYANA